MHMHGLADFNPHEREARDREDICVRRRWCQILIHTSVKLVTPQSLSLGRLHIDFNPHEREARDSAGSAEDTSGSAF